MRKWKRKKKKKRYQEDREACRRVGARGRYSAYCQRPKGNKLQGQPVQRPWGSPGTTESLWEKGGWKSCEVSVVIGKVTGETDSRMAAKTTRLSVGLVLLDIRVCGAWGWQRWGRGGGGDKSREGCGAWEQGWREGHLGFYCIPYGIFGDGS